ncbi:MAG TPA: type II/IV secretion system protein [Gemmatimonadales bacterium]|nr:type II/IV secretion system protein [Gemmatimonadales bacterium]
MPFTDEWLIPSVEPLVAPEMMAGLRREQATTSLSLWEALVQRRALTDQQILQAVAQRFRLPVADLSSTELEARVAVPEALARKHHVLPLRISDAVLEVATSNPFDINAEKELAFATGREVRMALAPPVRLREKIDEHYRPEEVLSKLLGGMDEPMVRQLTEEPDDVNVSAAEASARPIIRLVDMLLADGVTSRASDIHIEPSEGGVVVRYRIDGVLRQVMRIPRNAGLPVISRVKIMSGLDIADRLRPQDGRARVQVNQEKIDLRVSTLPASLGEKVVIRILNSKATVLALEALGLHDDERRQLTRLLDHKEGIVLVTGPTGSGKTTTLYSAIRLIQGEGVNIVTVEDPVEYKLGQNIVQVQVNEKAGLTFASALRSILRQDPDVVLVGEIRDRDTAQIAVQASLTGHLVLSTLHTNDAPNAVTRLVDMGIEAYKLGSALRGVVAQRLMRRLCAVCREALPVPAGDLVPEQARDRVPADAQLYKAVGCAECALTGYRGRFGITEILTMTQELEQLIGEGGTADRIGRLARQQGMKSLWESGLRHVLAGETSIDELLRVTDVPGHGGGPTAGPLTPAAPVAAPEPRDVAAARTAEPPVRRAAEVDLSSAFDLLEEELAAPPAPAAEGRRGVHVLLVDDEDSLRKVMRDLLERDGFDVTEARDGVEALDQADRGAPDIIVLDLNLPGLSGYDVLQRLRAHPATARTPVVVLTAKGDEDNEVRVFELGADDFLTKPFRARALSARLEAVLGRRRP